MNHVRSFLILLVLLLAVLFLEKYSADQKGLESHSRIFDIQSPQYELVRIVDGDTLIVESLSSSKYQRVRIIGIDAPELARADSLDECFSRESLQKLSEKINQGDLLYLESDPSQDQYDQYDRLLAHVFHNRKNMALEMLSEGFAREYSYDTPYRYQSDYKKAEQEAREQALGLWYPEACSEYSEALSL